jgi:hypothetical protein
MAFAAASLASGCRSIYYGFSSLWVSVSIAHIAQGLRGPGGRVLVLRLMLKSSTLGKFGNRPTLRVLLMLSSKLEVNIRVHCE